MLKVVCNGCGAPYRVDERRVPPKGLKMRCPKCGTTFVVHKNSGDDPSGSAQEPKPPAPPVFRSAKSKRTVLGVGSLPSSQPFGAPPAPPQHDLPSPTGTKSPDLDLPAPVGAKSLDVDLPAPMGVKSPDVDLPAPVGAKSPDVDLPAPVGVKSPDVDLPTPMGVKSPDVDLPAPVGVKSPDVDLPAPIRPRPRQAGLPVAATSGEPDLPAPVGLKRPQTFGQAFRPNTQPGSSSASPKDIPPPPDLDLPIVASPATGSPSAQDHFGDLEDFGDLPLPITSSGQVISSKEDRFGDPDLPLPAVGGTQHDPAPRQITGAALGLGDPDLPSIPEAELPSTTNEGFGELDLPLAATSLPSVANGSSGHTQPLREGSDQEDLSFEPQSSSGQPFGEIQAPGVSSGSSGASPVSPPTTNDDMFGSLDGDFGTAPGHIGGAELSFGEIPESTGPDLEGTSQKQAFSSSLDKAAPSETQSLGSHLDEAAVDGSANQADDLFGEPNEPQEQSAAAPPSAQITRQAGGGTRFGEVDLGDDSGDEGDQLSALDSGTDDSVGFGEAADDDMEFGAIPQESDENEPPPSSDLTERQEAEPDQPLQQEQKVKKKSSAIRILLVVLLVLVGGGLALSATPLGAFGMHFISDTLNAKSYARLLASTTANTRKQLAQDTASNARNSLQTANNAATQAPRFGPIAAYASYLGFLTELRFGKDPAVHAHSVALLKVAEIRAKDADYIPLARAGKDAVEGRLAPARQALQQLARRRSNSIDVAVLEGETELAGTNYQKALKVWKRASKLESSARTAFGLARSHFYLGAYAEAKKQAKAAMKLVPNHVGARLLLAQIERDSGSVEKATTLLEQILGKAKSDKQVRAAASQREIVRAYTMLGEIGLDRSRMSESEKNFAEALKLNPKDANALCGFGEVLYRAGRYAEALARFEAGIQAYPNSIRAQLGTAKTKLALERLQDAKTILKKLRASHPSDPDIAYWLARVEESLGHKKDAEAILTDAIGRKPKGRAAIRLYIALSKFLASQGRQEQSVKVLQDLRKAVPESAMLYKALAHVAMQAGRLKEAEQLFTQALKRDPDDLSSKFQLGVVLRRMGHFDAAETKFDEVASVDKNYPGLALEKGVLFEAAGQSQRALEMYQEALSKAPNDPDLMLRVGSAEVGAGHVSQAEQILRKVLRERPNSAEANHYLGRALLIKATNLAEALRFLSRATEIDPNRAEYWLYVGWAANEAGQPDTARVALKKALELDKSLADAYWQRGVLLRRQGAVVDAEKDLRKALELKPSRYEAYATLAECFEDESKWNNAIEAWKKAISSDGNHAFWRYKLGRLYYTGHQHALANEQLRQAVQLAKKTGRKPWLWEAYYMLGNINQASKRQDAIHFYREFLKLAPPDSPYRRDALKALKALGASID